MLKQAEKEGFACAVAMATAAPALASLPQVKALVPDSIFKRAKELASSNKLHAISFEGPGFQKSAATCAGSNPGDSYNLSILINAESPSKPMCQCSCPVALQAKGNLCKHVIALLLLRTQELAKVSKEQANALVLSEFKLAEDRLAEDKRRESSLSDSQATEPFSPSENKAKLDDGDTTATASSVSPVIKNNQKRVLPSWISGGFCAGKKEIKEKVTMSRTANKRTNKHTTRDSNAGEDEGQACTISEDKTAVQSRKGEEESSPIEDHMNTASRERVTTLRKRKKTGEETSHAHADFEAEDRLDKPAKNLSRSVRASRGIRGRNTDVTVKKGAPKRRKTRGYIESDLSEEDEPEVVGNDYPFESKEDLDLTSEDLVNLAKKHLEMEKGSSGHQPCQPGENAESDQALEDAPAEKKKGSIFSVQGWNEIATKNLDAKDVSFSQETFETPVLPSSAVAEVLEGNSQASGELCPNLLSSVSGNNTKGPGSMEPAENIVDDMLGLFFGPSLSKAVSSKSESTQAFVEDTTTISMTPLPESDTPAMVLPVSVDSVPKPKKKSSLKDKVMMYLG